MLRRFVSTALTLMAAAGLVMAGVSPASAAVVNRFWGVSPNVCLDAYNGHPDGEVYVTGCNSGNFQRFAWANTFTGTTTLRSQAQTSYCVQNAGSRVNLEPCSSAGYQRWEIRGNIGKLIIRQGNLCLARALGTTPNRVIMQGCSIPGSDWALTN
ncbi:ricin-type beta-trefoil lectin domain protein [Lentzea sp. NPDC005914]|uniref:ricin-type beta-trefoil lectin domain protein n=1 Tax=Lentzea sp. NPDC005914 TaxID=3154572 RepID=UPI00340340A4